MRSGASIVTPVKEKISAANIPHNHSKDVNVIITKQIPDIHPIAESHDNAITTDSHIHKEGVNRSHNEELVTNSHVDTTAVDMLSLSTSSCNTQVGDLNHLSVAPSN